MTDPLLRPVFGCGISAYGQSGPLTRLHLEWAGTSFTATGPTLQEARENLVKLVEAHLRGNDKHRGFPIFYGFPEADGQYRATISASIALSPEVTSKYTTTGLGASFWEARQDVAAKIDSWLAEEAVRKPAPSSIQLANGSTLSFEGKSTFTIGGSTACGPSSQPTQKVGFFGGVCAPSQPVDENSDVHRFELNTYELRNLLSLLAYCNGPGAEVVEPFNLANTGDWLGQVSWKFSQGDYKRLTAQHGNVGTAEMKNRVAQWAAEWVKANTKAPDDSVYCPTCKACGHEGCCPPSKCHYVDQYRGDYQQLADELDQAQCELRIVKQNSSNQTDTIADILSLCIERGSSPHQTPIEMVKQLINEHEGQAKTIEKLLQEVREHKAAQGVLQARYDELLTKTEAKTGYGTGLKVQDLIDEIAELKKQSGATVPYETLDTLCRRFSWQTPRNADEANQLATKVIESRLRAERDLQCENSAVLCRLDELQTKIKNQACELKANRNTVRNLRMDYYKLHTTLPATQDVWRRLKYVNARLTAENAALRDELDSPASASEIYTAGFLRDLLGIGPDIVVSQHLKNLMTSEQSARNEAADWKKISGDLRRELDQAQSQEFQEDMAAAHRAKCVEAVIRDDMAWRAQNLPRMSDSSVIQQIQVALGMPSGHTAEQTIAAAQVFGAMGQRWRDAANENDELKAQIKRLAESQNDAIRASRGPLDDDLRDLFDIADNISVYEYAKGLVESERKLKSELEVANELCEKHAASRRRMAKQLGLSEGDAWLLEAKLAAVLQERHDLKDDLRNAEEKIQVRDRQLNALTSQHSIVTVTKERDELKAYLTELASEIDCFAIAPSWRGVINAAISYRHEARDGRKTIQGLKDQIAKIDIEHDQVEQLLRELLKSVGDQSDYRNASGPAAFYAPVAKAIEVVGTLTKGPTIKYKSLSIDEHGVKAVMAEGNELAEILVHNLLEVMKAHGAANYIEMKVTARGEQLVFTLQRAQGRTPHELKVEAEQALAAERSRTSGQPKT